MKKLKDFAIVILILVVILTSIPIYAYIGEVDIDDNISISNIQSNGSGNIGVSRDVASGYKLSYQWVEIENNVYKQMKKLKDELTVIQYFNLYTETESDEDYETYYLSQQYYKNTYGENIANATPDRIKAIKAQINNLLPEHKGTWKTATNNNYSIDLNSFAGTKDYVLWVELEKTNGIKVYDAKAFELTGTKQNSSVSDEKIDQIDNISISDMLNGKGTINITRDVEAGYGLYYQWIEVNTDTYKQIKKLQDELKIIGYFNLYTETESEEDYETYMLAQQYYKEKYGENVKDASNDRIKAIKESIKKLTPPYKDEWQQTADNTYSVDLSTFSGTKYATLWAKLVKKDGTIAYDLRTFELTGTKQNSSASNEKVDQIDNISISDMLNGKGTINITRDVEARYELYYQWVDVDTDTYKQIKKLQDELKIIGYFNLYTETESEEDYETYMLAQQYYKEKYGENVKDASSDRIKAIKESINKLTPPYKDEWQQTADNTYSVDLSTFTGTKYATLWVKLVKKDGTIVYDSRTFELTGTKVADKPSTENPGTDEPGADNSGTDKPSTDNPGADNPGTDNPGADKPSTDNPGTDNPSTENPGTENPGTENPGADKPSTDNPGTDNPGTDKPSTDNPGTNNPSTDNPGTNNSSTNNSNTNKTYTNGSNQDNGTSKVNTKSDTTYVKGDTTTAKSNLAYTGIQKSVAIGGVCVLLGISIIIFIKYKNII